MAGNRLGEYKIARMLKAIEGQALTNLEIAARLHMGIDSVRRYIVKLLDEKPRRLHVVGFDEASRERPLARYLAGPGKDAVYVRAHKRRPRCWRRVEADRKRAEVLRLLALPQTSDQIAARMGISISRTTALIQEHREATPPRVFIKAWVPPDHKGAHMPVYAAGNEPDAPRKRINRVKEQIAAARRPPPRAAAGMASMLAQLM